MGIYGSDASFSIDHWNAPGILLVDLDCFYASVEQMDHPAWKGKPVIVGGDPDKRGVVSTASYEARKFGVHSAMASSVAAKLCPNAIWTRGNHARYKEVSDRIMKILGDETPFMQQVSIDEAFLDVTPTAHNPESPVRIAMRIMKRVEEEVGVTCSVGVGTTKTIAKVASDFEKPNGLTVVVPGYEREFLAPLPIRKMSGIGKSSEAELNKFGIKTLGDLAIADEALLKRVFGKNAALMRARAMGGEPSVVAQKDDVKSVSHETSFAVDLYEEAQIKAAISDMADKVGRRLRKLGLKGSCVSLKIRLADRRIRSSQMSLPYCTDDEMRFTPLLHDMLGEVWHEGDGVRLVGVGISHFDDDGEQLSLFEEEKPADNRLLKATDAIKDKFGENAVTFGHYLRNHGNDTETISD